MVIDWKEYNQRPERKRYLKEYLAKWVITNKEYKKNLDREYRNKNREKILKRKKEYWKKVKEKVNKRRNERWNNLPQEERGRISKKNYSKWKEKENEKRQKLGLPTTDENRKFKNFNQKKIYLLYKSLYPHNNVEIGYYPDWLINPKTGRKMELDIFDKENKIAIERNGPQHYKESDIFKYDYVQNIKYRDKIKEDICRKKGIKLIKFRYNEPHTQNNLVKKLAKVGIHINQIKLDSYLIEDTRKHFSEH